MNATPFQIPADITAKVGEIMARNQARFGHDLWRMEGETPPGDTPPGETPPATPPGEQPPAQKVEDLPDWAQKIIRDTRAEAAENRTGKTTAEQQRQEMLDNIAKALGLKPEETPTDPAELAKQVTAEQGKTAEAEARAQSAELQLAVFKAAPDNGGNAVALLDSASFLTSIKDLDPTDADAVAGAIKKAVEANPALKASTVPLTFGGGPRGGSKPEPEPGLGRLRDAYAESGN